MPPRKSLKRRYGKSRKSRKSRTSRTSRKSPTSHTRRRVRRSSLRRKRGGGPFADQYPSIVSLDEENIVKMKDPSMYNTLSPYLKVQSWSPSQRQELAVAVDMRVGKDLTPVVNAEKALQAHMKIDSIKYPGGSPAYNTQRTTLNNMLNTAKSNMNTSALANASKVVGSIQSNTFGSMATNTRASVAAPPMPIKSTLVLPPPVPTRAPVPVQAPVMSGQKHLDLTTDMTDKGKASFLYMSRNLTPSAAAQLSRISAYYGEPPAMAPAMGPAMGPTMAPTGVRS